MIKALKASKRFDAPHPIDQIAKKATEIVSMGNMTGEGWFLTGEMIELIEEGAPNIVCMQPFACLPNHVTGKGVIKALRKIDRNFPIIATGGPNEETIREVIAAGANAVTYTPPSNGEIFKEMMERYRIQCSHHDDDDDDDD